MTSNIDLSRVLKLRLELLVKEFKVGNVFAKREAQAIANKVALDYSEPKALEFYNALESLDQPLDYSWVKTVPNVKKDHPAFMCVGEPCNECCHRMLVSASSYRGLPVEDLMAYIVEGISAARDEDIKHKLTRILDRLLQGEDFKEALDITITELEAKMQIERIKSGMDYEIKENQ